MVTESLLLHQLTSFKYLLSDGGRYFTHLTYQTILTTQHIILVSSKCKESVVMFYILDSFPLVFISFKLVKLGFVHLRALFDKIQTHNSKPLRCYSCGLVSKAIILFCVFICDF